MSVEVQSTGTLNSALLIPVIAMSRSFAPSNKKMALKSWLMISVAVENFYKEKKIKKLDLNACVVPVSLGIFFLCLQKDLIEVCRWFSIVFSWFWRFFDKDSASVMRETSIRIRKKNIYISFVVFEKSRLAPSKSEYSAHYSLTIDSRIHFSHHTNKRFVMNYRIWISDFDKLRSVFSSYWWIQWLQNPLLFLVLSWNHSFFRLSIA